MITGIQDHLRLITLIVAVGTFLIAEVLILRSLWASGHASDAGEGGDERQPKHRFRVTAAEIIWTVLPACLLLAGVIALVRPG